MAKKTDRSKTSIPLTDPIEVDGVKVAALSMRCPKVKDMLAADKIATSDAEREIFLLSNLCEIPPDATHELDLPDYSKLQAAYQDFLS